MRCAERMRPLLPNQPPTRTDAQCTRRHNKWDKCSSEVMIRSAFILPVCACTNAPLTLMSILFAARRVALARPSRELPPAALTRTHRPSAHATSVHVCAGSPSSAPAWPCRSASRSSSSVRCPPRSHTPLAPLLSSASAWQVPHVARAASCSSAWSNSSACCVPLYWRLSDRPCPPTLALTLACACPPTGTETT